MYGHGAAPPTRSEATVISLRVLFAAAGFLSCGILACVPLFRVAILRGRWPDWLLAWVSLPLSIACFAVVGSVPETDVKSDIALAAVLLLGAFSSVYFLVMDIRFHSALRRQRYGGYAPAQATTIHAPHGPAGYGYPQPPAPYTTTPVQQPLAQQPPTPTPHPAAAPRPPMPQDAVPPSPVPAPPPPQRPAPARIDQVRAELDELSDYLRNHDGRGGDHEGGR
ncbi:hypothetical protein [Streptomyces cupreus]|uniref:Integral membrane protein n=1 Tax=Streptomyces cupreus TaxID=2759956 RepID=A0A7X1J4Z5_9ACTN|nr:hypothetical protein [Streptomyces cupreus]MBC2903784.1 hypothetical protein [Streptomyces cupreus]